MKNKLHRPEQAGRVDKKSGLVSASKPRRKALKSLLVSGTVVTGGSMLPKTWTKPVVDTIVLPSHAATTDDSGSLPGEGTTTAVPAVNYYFDLSQTTGLKATPSSSKQMFAERVLDTLIPTAHADLGPHIAYACISITGNTYTARVIWSPNGDYADYSGISGTVGTTQNLPHPASGYGFCAGTNVDQATILVDNVSPASCSCSISGNQTTVTITVNEGQCETPFIGQCED